MKAAMLVLVVLAAFAPVSATEVSPIQKVIQMLGDLETKVVGEGSVAQKEYQEHAEWCEDTSKNLQYEIKTGKAQVEELTATIEKCAANIESEDSKIGDLVASIASDEKDLAEATGIREKENADFNAERKELTTVIDMLARATNILEKEMSKSGASMLQLQHATSLTDALKIMVDASALSSQDASKLTALVQQEQKSDDSDDDMEMGSPAASVYEGHGGGIIDTLNGLTEKAQTQLASAEKKESAAAQNFGMLRQSLSDEIRFANKDKTAAEASKNENAETKATSEGDLSVTKSDLAEDTKALGDLHNECMTAANDFEAATKGRGEELTALATAKKVIVEATGGADSVSYGFVQVESSTRLSTRADLANFEVVRYVKELARKQHSPLLAQLASRMNSAIKLGHSESDVFAKVKGLIKDMVAKLEKEGSADAGEKEYCDKETAETTAKKEDKTAEVAKLSTKIDQAAARSAKLKEEVATLQKELADLAKSQAEMDKLRMEEKATFSSNKADLEQGIQGVKMALKVLNDYYSKESAQGSADGAASGIISMIEVCESDFSKDLAEQTAIEGSAAAEYDAQTKENDVTRTMKSQDEKYKTKEFTSLDKSVNELSSDKEGVQTELDAVLEYLAKINERCIAKAEPYAERKARRESEIDGLKEALEILETETALIQKTSRRSLRAVHQH